MKKDNKKIGQLGEETALRFLQKKGYQVLERNWGNKWGEIDLICQKDKTIIFVEVKTKVGTSFGSPEEMVNQKKLAQIQKTAFLYFKAQNYSQQIDVVAIVLDASLKLLRINHYEAVY